MKSIIIFGPAGAGKTTAAKMIAEMTGQHRVVSLGTEIKNICHRLGYSDQSERTEQQEVGQSMRKIFGDEVWCQYLWNQYRLAPAWMVNLVIDDGRQGSEFRYWRERGFFILGIVADKDREECRTRRASRLLARDGYDQQENFGHETEISADFIARHLCDDLIVNDGTKDDLQSIISRTLYRADHV